MRSGAREFLAILCALTTACSVGTPYRKPEIPLSQTWQAQDSGTGAAGPAIWPDADWWHGFGSGRLDELIAQAQQSNDDLAGAMARIQEADAQLRIAGAPLLPTVDLGASATRERAPVSGDSSFPTYNLFNPVLTASYELDFWGKNRSARDAARALAVASRYDRETVALTVVSSVATTYLQALELRERIEVAEQNLANSEKILKGLSFQQQVGTATGLDVAQQDTAVALLRAAIPPLQEQFRQTVYALAVLIGKTPETVDVTEGTLNDLKVPQVVAGLPSQLLARRPDVAEAEQQLISANADIGVARAELFPSIALTASGGYESGALASLVSPATRVWAVSAGLTQPIFHGGALRGQLAFSKARYTELLTTYHKTVLTALSNVESALVAAGQTAQQQTRQADAVAKAQRAYEFAQAQMAAGTINVLTVLNTENALFSAKDTLVQVQYARLQAMIDLYTALGGGWRQG
jgi:NodT family efflux transporter outer membrane factor (OMF) lipoprotein